MTAAAKSPVKHALELAFVALLICGACLWFLISGTQAGEIPAGRATFLGLGLFAGLVAHWAYMGVAASRAGRRAWFWVPLMVLTFPVASIVLAILLVSQAEESDRDRQAA